MARRRRRRWHDLGAARDRRHRSLRPDARPRRARRRRQGRAAGDPLERPTNRRRVRRDRGADRARPADRADRQPGAHGLHGTQAPLAAAPRARRLRPDRPRHAAEGLRAAAADGRVGDRRRRRIRARCCSTSPAAPGRPKSSTRSSCRRSCLPPVFESPEPTGATIAGDNVSQGIPGCRRRRRLCGGSGRGRHRPAGAAVDRDGNLRASSLPRCQRSPPTRRPACTRSVTPCPASGTRWA